MRELHILAGLVGLVAGFIALFAAKGRATHRASGRVFGVAMLVMAGLGALMAMFLHPNRVNVIAGTLAFYLVATGWLAVARDVAQSRRWLVPLTAAAALATLAAWTLGAMAARHPTGLVDHIPAGAIFMFAVVGTLGVAGDLRMLRAGRIEGARRITRHLWRMGYALWIATTSAFLGQAKFLPASLRAAHWNVVPVVLVLGVLVYWLLRVRVFGKRAAPAPTFRRVDA